MRKNIAISREAQEKIAKIFKVTQRTVRNALNLDYPATDIIKRIRMAAKENGGVMMATVPAGEMIHFADGTMRMDFDNGAYCEFYRHDESGHVFYKGKEVASYENITISKIYEIHEKAAALR